MSKRGGLRHPEIDDYTPKQTQEQVGRGALLVDVREQHEWNAGHIPGARHIPMGEIPKRLAELPRDRSIIFTCRSGNRSGHIKDLLIDEHGFTDVHNQLGGIIAWQLDGLPIDQ
jgi:phage shock protein E